MKQGAAVFSSSLPLSQVTGGSGSNTHQNQTDSCTTQRLFSGIHNGWEDKQFLLSEILEDFYLFFFFYFLFYFL